MPSMGSRAVRPIGALRLLLPDVAEGHVPSRMPQRRLVWGRSTAPMALIMPLSRYLANCIVPMIPL
jgi:hypothetical protein